MKFKPAERAGGLLVELGPREEQLPPVSAEEKAASLPAFKLKKILVPVDFSSCSKKALAYAIPLARQFAAAVTLLYVVRIYALAPEMGPVDTEDAEEAKRELETWRESNCEGVESNSMLRRGEPHAQIIDVAKALGMDLIVISTHGRSGLARVLMGSTAERVVRHAGCPVLVVREHEHEFVGKVIEEHCLARFQG